MQTTSGGELRGGRDRLEPVAGLADDLEVGLGVEDDAEARAHERLVVDEQHARHPPTSLMRGIRARTR